MMIRIDDEQEKMKRSSSILSFCELWWYEVMHEGRRAPSVHHFSFERGPNLIRAAGRNQEIDAGMLKKDVPASIIV